MLNHYHQNTDSSQAIKVFVIGIGDSKLFQKFYLKLLSF